MPFCTVIGSSTVSDCDSEDSITDSTVDSVCSSKDSASDIAMVSGSLNNSRLSLMDSKCLFCCFISIGKNWQHRRNQIQYSYECVRKVYQKGKAWSGAWSSFGLSGSISGGIRDSTLEESLPYLYWILQICTFQRRRGLSQTGLPRTPWICAACLATLASYLALAWRSRWDGFCGAIFSLARRARLSMNSVTICFVIWKRWMWSTIMNTRRAIWWRALQVIWMQCSSPSALRSSPRLMLWWWRWWSLGRWCSMSISSWRWRRWFPWYWSRLGSFIAANWCKSVFRSVRKQCQSWRTLCRRAFRVRVWSRHSCGSVRRSKPLQRRTRMQKRKICGLPVLRRWWYRCWMWWSASAVCSRCSTAGISYWQERSRSGGLSHLINILWCWCGRWSPAGTQSTPFRGAARASSACRRFLTRSQGLRTGSMWFVWMGFGAISAWTIWPSCTGGTVSPL